MAVTEQSTGYTLPDLTEKEILDWNRIEADFLTQPSVFELLLFKLHFKRKKEFNEVQKKNILRFLSTGYLKTNDVRYFNEFLWFCKDNEAEDLKTICEKNFNQNIDSSGCHYFPFADVHGVREYISKNAPAGGSSYNNKAKIGLIGFPPFFGEINKALTQSGFDVEQVFIPYHPNKYIRKLLSVPLLVKAVSKYKKNNSPYDTLNYHYTHASIGDELSSKKLDIGFHKLNFIIKKNIFGSFSRGLINDHWGALPFLRGKSTIAYTLLFGFPMAATLHLIEQGVDTGDIIGYYEYDVKDIKTINGVRDKLRSTLSGRVVDGISKLSNPQFQCLKNDLSKGLTFYEIHPWLYNFAEKRLQ